MLVPPASPTTNSYVATGDGFGNTCVVNLVRTHRPTAFTALAFVAVAAMIGLTACKSSSADVTSPAPAGSASVPLTSPAPSATATAPSSSPTTAPPSSATPSSPAKPTKLKMGSSGAAVMRLQQQLNALGYWLGTPDGRFGDTTQQAVFALQKAAGLSPTGSVTATTQAKIDAGIKPTPRSKSGRMIEINLKRDLIMFVTNGQVTFTINTSTGGGYVYQEEGMRNVANTPRGHFTTYRVIDGSHRSKLGLLFRPRYFTGGFAIHGDSYVPAHPVSHGCARVSNAAINWIWANNLDAIGTPVWVY